jgi:hypothetical protein
MSNYSSCTEVLQWPVSLRPRSSCLSHSLYPLPYAGGGLAISPISFTESCLLSFRFITFRLIMIMELVIGPNQPNKEEIYIYIFRSRNPRIPP